MKVSMKEEMKILTMIALMGTSSMGLAQGDPLLAETDSILNSDQINIDGSFRKETAADRIEKMRKRLESQNEQMVQKKIEDIRINQEKELSGKLQKAFRGNMQAMDSMDDSVGTVQAAPQRIVAPAPVVEETKAPKNKIIPFFGVKQYNGDNIDAFESNVNAGLQFENMVTEQLGVGIQLNYTTMDITDRNSFVGFNNFNNFGFNEGDEINYTNLNIALTGKFYFTKDSMIKPYAGAGVGYNRTTLKYAENNSQFNNGLNFGSNSEAASASGSNVSGSGMLGAEVLFNDNLGINLEFNYTRAITSAFDQSRSNNLGFNDAAKNNLRTIGDNLEASDIASLNLGFVIKF